VVVVVIVVVVVCLFLNNALSTVYRRGSTTVVDDGGALVAGAGRGFSALSQRAESLAVTYPCLDSRELECRQPSSDPPLTDNCQKYIHRHAHHTHHTQTGK
jgi:hypothetical protein